MRLIDAEPLEEILRSRCAQCSNDYGSIAGTISGCLKLVQAQPTIDPEPNPPLTLEELQEMDGEPVWVEYYEMEMAHLSGWGIRDDGFVKGYHTNYCDGDYGKTWLAYRRKPEVSP